VRPVRSPLAGRLPYLGLALLALALDRGTKILVEAHLDRSRSVEVIPGFFDLTYVRNPGGVFGILRNLDEGIRSALFTIFPAIAIVFIAAYAAHLPASRKLAQASLALILGGAAGNLVDRLRYGQVIDFLDVYWRDYHWPAFNLADSAICIGVGMLILETVLAREEPAPDAAAGAQPAGPAPRGGASERHSA